MCNTQNCYLIASRSHRHHLGVKQPNIQVMGLDPTTFLLQHRIQRYKQVNMKNLQKQRKSVSYQPLGLVDVTVHPVVVH
jgi:hypothetical protein